MEQDILQVITDRDRRGAQIFAVDLHEALERIGRSVRTVALAPGRVGGIDIDHLGQRRLGPSTLWALRRHMRAAGVVVAHGSTTLPACVLAGSGLRIPLVYRQISDSLFWARRATRRWRVCLELSRSTRVVALSPGAAEVLTERFRVRPDKTRVIPNGVPPDHFPPVDPSAAAPVRMSWGLDPQRPTVVCVAALVPEKAVELAVSAVARLDDVQLLVVGDGPERARLQTLASQLAPRRIVFTRSMTNPADAFAAADLIVLPSERESMPAVLIEAGFSQLPAVATSVGAVPEIIVNGVTGILVPVGSSTALTDAIRHMASDRDYRLNLGRAARRRCLELFAIDRIASEWERVLAEVLGEARPYRHR